MAHTLCDAVIDVIDVINVINVINKYLITAAASIACGTPLNRYKI